MKNKYIKSLLWVIKLQLKISRSIVLWRGFYSVIMGLRPIVQAFALAKLISSVSATALTQGSANNVYLWLFVLLAIELLGQAITSADNLIRLRFQQQIGLAMNEGFITKMYELSQEQYDDQEFNTKLDRARDSLFQVYRITDDISTTTSSAISFVGALFAVLVVSPVVGALVILAVVPAMILQVKQNRMREEMYKKIEPIDRVAFRTRWLLIDPNFMPEIRLMNAFKKMLKT